ncbi:hypothetical protein [Flavobacterium defluvii]|uniref:Uncharacterized protein n=1 Tax=Flavobacterium defluvii TaxID=370979 RepID=A0A1M5RE42_9FLAO|nr:hypothetical protein [Flavobacterium defluvii]SHH24346.1 hypothetical protein SAMN05443663_106183 [Flavobacterium defluvii]
MKLKQRFLVYLLLAILYFFATSLLIILDEKLKINDAFITVPCGFVLINIAYTFLFLKLNPLLNILSASIIPFLSLFLALKFSDLHLFSRYDAYDIGTAIIANAIFPIIFWEIIYQIKNIYSLKSVIK